MNDMTTATAEQDAPTVTVVAEPGSRIPPIRNTGVLLFLAWLGAVTAGFVPFLFTWGLLDKPVPSLLWGPVFVGGAASVAVMFKKSLERR